MMKGILRQGSIQGGFQVSTMGQKLRRLSSSALGVMFALMIGLSAGIVRADGQDDVMDAIKQKKNLYFVEIKDVKVSKILPDDTQGLPHQRWLVKLADGREIMAVYNTGEFSRVPMKEGDVVNMGGEFKMTEVGPLIHWLHEDPRDRRPDGYVQRDGVEYGKITK